MSSKLIGTKYRISKRVGGGSFGEIYSGDCILSGEEVAIKFESTQARPQQLFYESTVYKLLAGGVGIPSIKWYGVEGDCNAMVIEMLGKSLEDLFIRCQRNFSLKTVLMIADQLITRIEYFHMKGFVHRDIKPDNFLVGKGNNNNSIYIIDYGLSKKFRDHKTLTHIPYKDGKTLTGTARYASINTHNGSEQSRRDDLEGIGYVLIYFLKGGLPWQGINAKNRQEKYEMIGEFKRKISIEELCQGIPIEFLRFLEEIRRLGFEEKPHYTVYKQLFKNLFIKEGFVYDYEYDWTIKNRQVIDPDLCTKQCSSNSSQGFLTPK